MYVKWHALTFGSRGNPGGVPERSTCGNVEFSVKPDNNVDHIHTNIWSTNL